MTKKILLIAPHPFYQERGTPIAVDLLLRALTEQGYSIDLLTFNEGTDVHYPGLTIFRVSPFFKVEGVRPGFSLKKLILDVYIFFKFITLFFRKKYHAVHAVEESAFMAMLVCPMRKVPYIYDMDSSMVTQLIDKMPWLKPIEVFIRWLESLPMKHAELVIPVCQALAGDVYKYRNDKVFVLKDVSLVNEDADTDADNFYPIREKHDLRGPVFMYIGNLESYQGIDLMIDAFSIFSKDFPEASLVIIGGADSDIVKYQQKCSTLGLQNEVIFLGRQPIAQINNFMKQADVLVSPRVHGVNTAMKVYSYLDSGVPVLATRLPTHTQVVDDSHCFLAEPEPDKFARGMAALVDDRQLRESLSQVAKQLIETEHSYAAFKERLTTIYQNLPGSD